MPMEKTDMELNLIWSVYVKKWYLYMGGVSNPKHCLRMCDTKGSTYLLWDIATEKSGLCCYAVRITQNTYVKK